MKEVCNGRKSSMHNVWAQSFFSAFFFLFVPLPHTQQTIHWTIGQEFAFVLPVSWKREKKERHGGMRVHKHNNSKLSLDIPFTKKSPFLVYLPFIYSLETPVSTPPHFAKPFVMQVAINVVPAWLLSAIFVWTRDWKEEKFQTH